MLLDLERTLSAFRAAVVLSVAGLALAACSGSETYEDDAGPLPDGGGPPAAQLRVITEPSLALLFGEEAEFAVRYTEMDGTPIPAARVIFSLVNAGEGTANDSSLSALDERTDSEGVARGVIMAGRTPSVFQIQISAERSAPARIDVSVSDAGFGGLHATVARVEGVRPVTRREVTVFAERSCADDGVFDGPGNRSPVTLGDGEDDARFFALPAGLTYATVARGFSDEGSIVAWGCTDGIPLVADEETDVDVLLSDLPLDLEGDYSTEVAWGATDAAALLGRTTRLTGHRAVDTAGGDGPFLLDALVQMLRDGGRFSEADAIDTARSSGDMDTTLTARFAASATGPAAAVDELAMTLEGRTDRVALSGTLSIHGDGLGGVVMTWMVSTATAGSGAPDSPDLPIDFASLGVAPDATVSGAAVPDADALDLSMLRVDVPLGAVALGALASLADERRADGTVGLMVDRGGCALFQEFARERAELSSACDDACVLTACKAALENAAGPIEAALGDLSATRSVVRLSGAVDLSDELGNLRVDLMTGDALAGEWASADDSERDVIAGTMAAARMIE